MIRKLGVARIAAAAVVAAGASAVFGGVALAAADTGSAGGSHPSGWATDSHNRHADVDRAGNGGNGGNANPDCGNQLVQVIDSSRTDVTQCNGDGGAGGNGHSSVY
jgi:hypothetical protein